MDDPWGSPWADELQHDTPTPVLKKEVVGTGEVPINVPPVVEERVRDAWGTEDDGFGEWATLPADDGEVSGALGLDGASHAWDTKHKGDDGSLTNGAAVPWKL